MEDRLSNIEKRLQEIENIIAVRVDTPAEVDPRSPFTQQVHQVMKEQYHLQLEKGEMALLFAGIIPGTEGDRGRDWAISGCSRRTEELSEHCKGIVTVASALANAHRVQIVLQLMQGKRLWAELVDATGLSPGQLYHHVKDLQNAGLVEQPERSRYKLTSFGTIAITALALLDGYKKSH